MKIERRPATEPFRQFLGQAKGVTGLWARFVGAVAAFSLIFGPYAPLGFVAVIVTVGLPILLLTMWGRSLDSELNWTEMDEGPW